MAHPTPHRCTHSPRRRTWSTVLQRVLLFEGSARPGGWEEAGTDPVPGRGPADMMGKTGDG